jgi:DNA-binding NarL/FixJ family response regulator
MKEISVMLVDDQALFRDGLRAVLSVQPGIRVVAEASNGKEAVACAQKMEPQVVLMDLRMPVMNGVEATRAIRAAMPASGVIVLTTFDDDEQVFDALRAGALGYLLKDAPPARLVEAIRAAARGESFLQPSIAAKVLAEFNRLSPKRQSADNRSLWEKLSSREIEVLKTLAEGKSNKEIGVALNLAEGTVKNHLSNIFGKLGVLDRTQAALLARARGLI